MAGERDEKFAAIGRRMAEVLPDAAVVIVPGAGHAPHLDRPAAVLAALAAWQRT